MRSKLGERQMMDGVVCVAAATRNARRDDGDGANQRAGIFVYAGTIKPGFWKGQKLTIARFRGGGRSPREDLAGGFDGIEKNACPSWALAAASTPRTPCFLVRSARMSLLGSSQMASPDPEKADRRGIGEGPDRRDQEKHSSARHHHAQIHRERGRGGHGQGGSTTPCCTILRSRPLRREMDIDDSSACAARCRCCAI